MHVECFYPLHLNMYILYAALLQTAAGSEIIFLKQRFNIMSVPWPLLATYLGCTTSYINEMYGRKCLDKDSRYVLEHVKFPERCLFKVAVDWGDREEGTGSRPRNWKTVLEVYRKLCVGLPHTLSELASFEKKLISGVKWY